MISEIIGVLVVTGYMAYIFTGFIRYPGVINFKEQLKLSAIISAPAVILHEMAHKFTAVALGYPAQFMAFYEAGWTLVLAGISIFLRMIHAGFIFIVPGFVLIPANTPVLDSGIIAFAGPLTNLIIWAGVGLYLKYNTKMKEKTYFTLIITRKINMFLFIFNMIPFGMFDGAKVLNAVLSLI